MSSFLCFVCHSTVNADTNEDTRDKYREVIGMHLCPDSHLCYICCHFLNKMCLFKSICLKRSLEYPVLFSEKGTINLQKSDTQVAILCPEDFCIQHLNSRYHFCNTNDNSQSDNDNEYVQLQHERQLNDNGTQHNDNDDFHNDNYILNNDNFFNELLPSTETKNDGNHMEYNQIDASSQTYDISNNVIDTENELFCKHPDHIIPALVENKTVIESNESNLLNENCNMKSYNQINFQEAEIQNNDTYNHSPGHNESGIMDNERIDNDRIDNEVTNNDYNESDNEFNDSLTESEEVSIDLKIKKTDFEKIVLSIEEQRKELESNRKSKKYIESDFKCHSCAMGFLIKDSYQAHMMRHEESNGEHRCVVCKLRFASPAVLRVHLANHAERYRCTTCDVIVRKRQRQTHVVACRGSRTAGVACHLCGNVFQSVSHFQQHLKRFHHSKTSSRTYTCNQCGKTYNNQAALRTHMLTHANKKFTCETCNAVLSSPYTLNQHKKKHTETQQHYCTSCKISFSRRKYLLAHFKNTLAHRESVYKCSVCERTCPSLKSLKSHISAIHERSKHLSCNVCPARYSTRKGLVRHMSSHKTDGQIRTPLCHACGEKFKSTSILKRHLKNVCEKDKMDDLCQYYEQ